MENYWKDFYTTPEAKEATALEQQIGKLLEQAGQTRKNNSAYQNYVDSWQDFLASINGGSVVDMWA